MTFEERAALKAEIDRRARLRLTDKHGKLIGRRITDVEYFLDAADQDPAGALVRAVDMHQRVSGVGGSL